MLIRMLTSGNPLWLVIIQFVMLVLALIIVLPIHECAHAWVAYRMGDESQKAQGRMTLNPLKHLDPIGAVCLLLTGFGWAKPVYVNSALFRRGGKYAGMWVSLAGPASNLIVGFIFCGLTAGFFALTDGMKIHSEFQYYALETVAAFLMIVFEISVNLAVVNLIPVPPFDGYGILSPFLPDKVRYFIARYQRFITLGLLVLLVTNTLSLPIGAVSGWIQKLMKAVFGVQW